jgi:predicted phosphodiesterase
MAAREPYKSEIIREFLKKYPSHPNLTIARLIYKKHPSTFTNVDNVRSLIRVAKGQHGNKSRKDSTNKSLFTTPGKLNPFDLPESYAEKFEPYEIKQSKGLIISDLHFPYQDNKAITEALKYGLEKKVNFILINGDLLDFAAISRHERDWRQRLPHEEFEAVRKFLNTLRKTFPNAKIIFKLGNHDERWEKWLFVKAPELFDDPEFKLEVRLKLGELKIDIVKDKQPIKIGKLTVLHGHELAGGSGGVNPARAAFLKTLDSVLIGHFHKTSQHTEASMYGDVLSVNSQGCLCGMHPHYMPVNKWNHGFCYVEHNLKTGDYLLHNLKIIKGKVF